jgi:NAD(P)-dependent dehydrogenase (short-subunit alcohol dehydrogenase family)
MTIMGSEMSGARRVDAPRVMRVALVTGGTGGIGTEICRRLAEDGNRVVATHLASEAALAER